MKKLKNSLLNDTVLLFSKLTDSSGSLTRPQLEEIMSNKFKISYFDNQGSLRHRYITANNERDALVDCWLNNKNVIEPVSVTKI